MYDNKATARAVWIAKLLCIVTAALAVLRLLRVIRWPWLWVAAPVWAPLALVVLFALIAAVVNLYDRRR